MVTGCVAIWWPSNAGFAIMRVWRVGCVLVLWLTPATTFAQSVQGPASAPAPAKGSLEEVQAIKERVSSWLKTCLQDWDTATHMSPREWEVTCQRVANERGKFLLENPDTSLTMGPKGRQR
jgi:hypothetical protein